MTQHEIDFRGSDYCSAYDRARLTGQIERIFRLMSDGQWRTLDEIHSATNAPQASISAQLRNLRKHTFGGHIVERRRRGEVTQGLFEYRLIVNK